MTVRDRCWCIPLAFAVLALICGASSAQASCKHWPEVGYGQCNPLRGGVWLQGAGANYGTCTLGYIVASGPTRYGLTAGHCLSGGVSEWTEPAGASAGMCEGLRSVAWRLDTIDAGLVTTGNCAAEDWVEAWQHPWTLFDAFERPSCSMMAQQKGGPQRPCFRYYHEHEAPGEDWINPSTKMNPSRPYEGEEVCLYGHEEDHSCGKVWRTNQSVTCADGVRREHMFEVTVKSFPGDSGGALDARVEPNSVPEAKAVGIYVCEGWGEELPPVLEAMGVSLP